MNDILRAILGIGIVLIVVIDIKIISRLDKIYDMLKRININEAKKFI